MRPWPLLLLAASSDARCGCDRRVIVATTVNGVRTASLLVPSAARVGAALVVYHEDSADAAAGLEPPSTLDDLIDPAYAGTLVAGFSTTRVPA